MIKRDSFDYTLWRKEYFDKMDLPGGSRIFLQKVQKRYKIISVLELAYCERLILAVLHKIFTQF